ncbi:MAG: hypothetical protein K2X77_29960 [Candidatus Obscuribacterales bacterium]|jgi:hypothetical protein|nr:hypothetical protein [Candidatus Obscuribacterales bacterium]
MFNFLTHCDHIPKFGGIFGATKDDREIRPYANFGLPEAVSSYESAGCTSSKSATIIGDENNNGIWTGEHHVSRFDSEEAGDNSLNDGDLDEHWFYIPSGPEQ